MRLVDDYELVFVEGTLQLLPDRPWPLRVAQLTVARKLLIGQTLHEQLEAG